MATTKNNKNNVKTNFNYEVIVDYIKELVNIPSPTGFTHFVTEYLVNNAKEKNIDYDLTRKGAVIYKFLKSDNNTNKNDNLQKNNLENQNSQNNNLKNKNILFAAHVDTLGAIVSEVKDYGLKISSIGGYPPIYIIGDYCRIHTFDGKIYSGTILPENPAAHVNIELDNKKFKIKDLFIRVDIDPDRIKSYNNNLKENNNSSNESDKNCSNNCNSKENKIRLKDIFSNGNFVSFDPKFEYIDGFVKSRHLDDKASAAIFLYLSDLIIENKIKPQYNIYFYFNITEETGQGIAGFTDIDEMIVVDMGCVGNNVSGDEFNVSIAAKDSSGPYNYEITQRLIKLAKQFNIGHKIDIFPYYGSDGSGALRAGNDIKVALIGQGVSASHGLERTHIKGLTNTFDLIKAYIEN